MRFLVYVWNVSLIVRYQADESDRYQIGHSNHRPFRFCELKSINESLESVWHSR